MAERKAHAFNQLVFHSPQRLALPIANSPGFGLTGANVRELVTNPQAQAQTQLALQQRHPKPFVLSAMDLSAEAEAFGCTIQFSDLEVPTVTGRRVTSLAEARQLAVPEPGDARTGVYLETVRLLRASATGALVLGCCIGPFSLAARLAGVSEAMLLTLTEPELMHTLIGKSASFLAAYVRAFQQAGADGLLMAEPAAGLLSPQALAAFSSAYIRTIAAALDDGDFALILHNCAAKLVHLPAILETGLQSFHFGAPMDLGAALGKVPLDVVLCGNLDPVGVFCRLTPAEVVARTTDLLTGTRPFRNYVLSSGCDLPPDVPLANLDAFHEAVQAFNDQAGQRQPDSLTAAIAFGG